MKIKKVLSIILIVAMVATSVICLSGCGSSDEAGLYLNGELVQTWDELLESIGYTSFGRSKIIENKGGELGSYFKDCNGDLILPSDITEIGDGAFVRCKNLTSVILPDGVTSIDKEAFEFCYSLTSINIPDSVTNIGDYAFNKCKSLTSITIPDSVTNIGFGAFAYSVSKNSDTYELEVIDLDITIYGESGSYAEEYANENNIKFVAQ